MPGMRTSTSASRGSTRSITSRASSHEHASPTDSNPGVASITSRAAARNTAWSSTVTTVTATWRDCSRHERAAMGRTRVRRGRGHYPLRRRAYMRSDCPGCSTRTSTAGPRPRQARRTRAAAPPNRPAAVAPWRRACPNGSGWRSSARAADRLRRARRVEVAGREVRSPPGDREECDVDRAGEVAHALEQVGVAGEVDAGRPVEDESQRRCAPAERPAPPVVKRGGGGDLDAADLDPLAGVDLRDVADPSAPHELPAAARHDNRTGTRDEPQRGQVEVIEVSVRHEHRVQSLQRRDVRVMARRAGCAAGGPRASGP